MGRSRTRALDPIASLLCEDCRLLAQLPEGSQIARQLLYRPVVPTGYEPTHAVCQACLGLRRLNDRHTETCVLARAGLRLSSGGWATPYSEALRADLRSHSSKWVAVSANIVASVMEQGLPPRAVIVPVPTASEARGCPGLSEVARQVGRRTGLPVLNALLRKKRRSTRRSVAQVRRQIIEEEYLVDRTLSRTLHEANVVLVDDTVTTGLTLTGTAALLRAVGASQVLPVTIDRTISARLNQLLAVSFQEPCDHIRSPKNAPSCA